MLHNHDMKRKLVGKNDKKHCWTWWLLPGRSDVLVQGQWYVSAAGCGFASNRPDHRRAAPSLPSTAALQSARETHRCRQFTQLQTSTKHSSFICQHIYWYMLFAVVSYHVNCICEWQQLLYAENKVLQITNGRAAQVAQYWFADDIRMHSPTPRLLHPAKITIIQHDGYILNIFSTTHTMRLAISWWTSLSRLPHWSWKTTGAQGLCHQMLFTMPISRIIHTLSLSTNWQQRVTD